MPRHKRLLGLLGVAVAVAAGAVFFGRPRPLPEPVLRSWQGTGGAPAPRPATDRPRRAPARPAVPRPSRGQSTAPDDSFAVRRASALDELGKLDQKTLFTPGEAARRHEILSDAEILASVADELRRPTLGVPAETQRRLDLVRFLHESLVWSENPAAPAARQAAVDVIMADNLATAPSREDRERLAGDKAELYRYLHAAAPDAAQALRDQSVGTLHRLLLFADQARSPAE